MQELVDAGYLDAGGQRQRSAPETVEAIRACLRNPAAADSLPLLIVRPGQRVADSTTEILTEDKRKLVAVDGVLPRDCPIGYHRAHIEGVDRDVAVSPGRCYLPPGLHTWTLSVQLYAARSQTSWGIGDFAALSTVARWTADHGGGSVLLSPLHAPAPVLPQERSPYFPASRAFKNPIYLALEPLLSAIPQLESFPLDTARNRGTALNRSKHIDYDAVFALKMSVLESLFQARANPDSAPMDAATEKFATFCALSEQFGRDHRRWPGDFQSPGRGEVALFREQKQKRIAFFAWLQQLISAQLQEAGANFSLIHDLAVGVDPGGADVWMHPHLFARAFRVGAPPDTFNTKGQDWGQPPPLPLVPSKSNLQPLISALRSVFFAARGVRIDHIMGFFRLFWIPEGAPPKDGAYVRYPYSQLLDILALESHRARAYVVGEDLGTVPAVVRREMARRNILSYRLMLFEDVPPRLYPQRCLAAISTHDLPTVAGLWTGEDLEEQLRFELEPNITGTQAMQRQMQVITGSPPETAVAEVVLKAYAELAGSPAMVAAASLDDLALTRRRPNLPGTVPQERDNWAIPLPRPVEEILQTPLAEAVAGKLAQR